jgi:hypothetical protein
VHDLDKALSEISVIREHLAGGILFRGVGPLVIALTAILALLLAFMQSVWPMDLAATPIVMLINWVGLAIVCAGLIGVEMLTRSRQHHGDMASTMIMKAIENFLPAAAAGLFIAVVFAQFAPKSLWTLPGLWQVLMAIGLSASLTNLPRAVRYVAAWYFAAGICVLALSAQNTDLSPWYMGFPFFVGQLMMAAILYKADKDQNEQ